MIKSELLSSITALAQTGEITFSELQDAFQKGSQIPEAHLTPATKRFHLKISDVLYYLGGLIIFVGISIFLSQNWGTFNTLTRIISTLGSGFAAYFTAMVLSREEKFRRISDAFHFVGCLVIPIGTFVTAHELGLDLGSSWIQTLLISILCVFYGLSFFVYRKTIVLIFLIAYCSSLFMTFSDAIIGNPILISTSNLYSYRFMALGVTYLFLSRFLFKSTHAVLSEWLNAFGTIFIFTSLATLIPFANKQTNFWELIYPFVCAFFIYMSTVIQSKSCLLFTAFFMLTYIFQITSKYFADSIGWPLALICFGFVVIAVGYMTINLSKKFNRSQQMTV